MEKTLDSVAKRLGELMMGRDKSPGLFFSKAHAFPLHFTSLNLFREHETHTWEEVSSV